jgi:hypothetical protein
MSLRVHPFLIVALAAAAPFITIQPASAQQSVNARLNRRAPANAKRADNEVARPADAAAQVNAQGDRIASAEPSYTLAQVRPEQTATDEATEAERIVVRGFDVDPVEYPRLPEVEGTRINSGKKTSFVKPEEFPTISNNNYRQALATTPGLLVSEEPSLTSVIAGWIRSAASSRRC